MIETFTVVWNQLYITKLWSNICTYINLFYFSTLSTFEINKCRHGFKIWRSILFLIVKCPKQECLTLEFWFCLLRMLRENLEKVFFIQTLYFLHQQTIKEGVRYGNSRRELRLMCKRYTIVLLCFSSITSNTAHCEEEALHKSCIELTLKAIQCNMCA